MHALILPGTTAPRFRAIDWAERAVPELPVVITIQQPNTAALRVADKLGFRPAGETDLGQGPKIVLRRPRAAVADGAADATRPQESTMVT